jgi:hypothetical protein
LGLSTVSYSSSYFNGSSGGDFSSTKASPIIQISYLLLYLLLIASYQATPVLIFVHSKYSNSTRCALGASTVGRAPGYSGLPNNRSGRSCKFRQLF